MRVIVKAIPVLVPVVLVSCICAQPSAPGAPAGPATSPQTVAPTSFPTAANTVPVTLTLTDTPTPNRPATPVGQGTVPATVAPGQVKAEPLDTSVRLQWLPLPEARGYLVYRGGRAESLNHAPVTYTQYEDIGLTNGKVYTYTVVAVDAAGQAFWRSAEIDVVAEGK